MAFDAELADRVRTILGRRTDLSEKRMFGGLALLLNGNMVVAVRGQGGGLMVRLDPAHHAELLAEPGAEPTVMRGREMRGWITLGPSICADTEIVEDWVDRAVEYVEALPPK